MSNKTDNYNGTVNKKEVHSSVHSSTPAKCEQKNFGSRLKKLRSGHGFSQKELGKAIGVSVVTIQSYEGGKLPKGEHTIALADALGCTTDELLRTQIKKHDLILEAAKDRGDDHLT